MTPYDSITAFLFKTGQASCVPCGKGLYADRLGQSECKKCPRGSYQNYAGSFHCSSCEPGFKCPTLGLAVAIPCPADTYSDNKVFPTFALFIIDRNFKNIKNYFYTISLPIDMISES